MDKHIKYQKRVMKAQKKLIKSIDLLIKNEQTMYDGILAKEKELATIDGIPYSKEEMEQNAMKQIENSPFKVAFSNAEEELLEVMKDG